METRSGRIKADVEGFSGTELANPLLIGNILKQAARRYVPGEVIDRPKGYFPVPSLRYLRGPFLSYVSDILTSRKARERGLYDRGFVDHMLQNPESEMSPKGHSRLWQAALLEAWLQAHEI